MKQNKMITITIPLDKTDAFITFYEHERVTNNNPYVLFAAKHDELSILLYQKEHHGNRKAVFSGPNSYQEASLWGVVPPAEPKAEQPKLGWQDLSPQIGSDEVGTGDFFGPIIVVATYFGVKHQPLLEKYRIGDSKTISDDVIRQLGPQLIKVIPYSLLTVTNEKYNELVKQGFNINKIKAWLHQSVLSKLRKKYRSQVPVYIDQFCTPLQFKKYIESHPETYFPIVFKTKAENQFPSVAIASIIARYAFLNFMDKLNHRLGVTFPLGAGLATDKMALKYAKQKGLEQLNPLVKQNFKNYQRLLDNLKND